MKENSDTLEVESVSFASVAEYHPTTYSVYITCPEGDECLSPTHWTGTSSVVPYSTANELIRNSLWVEETTTLRHPQSAPLLHFLYLLQMETSLTLQRALLPSLQWVQPLQRVDGQTCHASLSAMHCIGFIFTCQPLYILR